MKIWLIRHGDPDYTVDSLTPKGWREAQCLAEKFLRDRPEIRDFYVSPLGRAKDTASLTLDALGRTARELDWLREFPPRIDRPDRADSSICWDWLPQDWTKRDGFYSAQAWSDEEEMRAGGVQEAYAYVAQNLDLLLAQYGYEREDKIYRVHAANNDTIVLFCHFGVGCVIISHLLGISPMPLWHGMCAAPSSVTRLVTEERRRGIASFRMTQYGDVSHLYAMGEEPAFAARFCECFENEEERHD